MMYEDLLLPRLMHFFAHYLKASNVSSSEAHELGPDAFVTWLRKSLLPPDSSPDPEVVLEEWEEEEEEEEEEYEEREDLDAEDEEALHILRHLVHESNPEWLAPYWGRLITSFRKAPKHLIAELYAAFVVRWEDGHLLPFVCSVPEMLIQPKGSINDQLLMHISEIFSSQFVELLTNRSVDELHELQSGLLSKDTIRKVLRLARDAVEDVPKEERVPLQRALRFLRAVSLPLLPPEALHRASQSLGPKPVSKPDWRVFPIEEEEE